MFGNTEGRKKWTRWPRLLMLLASASVLLVMAFASSQALAGRLADLPQAPSGAAMTGLMNNQSGQPATAPGTADRAHSPSSPNAVPITGTLDGFIFMVPDTVTLGTCPAPANGGTTQVGCRFVLDLFVNAGVNQAPDGITAQQSYITFTYQTIQNGRVSSIATSCVLTSIIAPDIAVFDAPLQNDVCN